VTTDHDGYGRFIDDADVPDTGNGEPPIVDMGAYEYQAVALYVDDDAPIGGDGSTWDEALRFLQDALLAAGPGVRVKVAGGIYRPDASSAHPDGTGDRETSFILADGVRILGGYAGQGAADPDERNPDLYETMLSGDLNGDDGPNVHELRGQLATHRRRRMTLSAVLLSLTASPSEPATPMATRLIRWVAGGAGLLCDGADLVIRRLPLHGQPHRPRRRSPLHPRRHAAHRRLSVRRKRRRLWGCSECADSAIRAPRTACFLQGMPATGMAAPSPTRQRCAWPTASSRVTALHSEAARST
jgi:hypothetical protein